MDEQIEVKPETPKLDKMDKIFEMMHNLTEKVKGLESENEKLKTKILEADNPKGSKFEVTANGLSSEWHEKLEERNREAEQNITPVILQKENGFQGIVNECPYCLSKKEDSLLDLNPRSNRYQCRRCGKSWNQKHLKMPYSLEMEKDYDGQLVYNKDTKKYDRPVAV